MENLQQQIESYWQNKNDITPESEPGLMENIEKALELMDQGKLRVAEKHNGSWIVNDWAKQAVLLSFKYKNSKLITANGTKPAENGLKWYDKVPLKGYDWDENRFEEAGFRSVPLAVVRHSAYVAPNVVLMPSYINVGAYVDSGSMIDTWATVGSCAQIGKNCHISGGTGIGGVLEPIGAKPTIIEDNCFIGARSEIAEGVIVEEGSVISMGVFIGASTKIVDRETGKIYQGHVPAYSVVVPGTLPGKTPSSPHLYCAVIVKTVDEKTRSKTSINELLRNE